MASASESSPQTARRFPIAPLPLLSAILLGGLAIVFLCLVLALQGPWLGATFVEADGPPGGIIVASVHEDGPAADRLRPGDRILAIRTARQGRMDLRDFDPALEPHTRPTFDAYNRVLAAQGRLDSMLRSPRVQLHTDRGPIRIEPAAGRPLSSLSPQFWLFHLFGLMALIISAAVWVFRRQEPAALYLALSGLGFFIATAAHSVWITRELALPSGLFDGLLRVNHLGLTLLIAGIICFLASYPSALRGLRVLRWSLLALLVYQLNENLQWLELPWHTFYLPILITYPVAVMLAVHQWRKSRDNPVDRAAMKWIFLSVFLSMGGGVVIYFLPTLLGQSPGISQVYIVASGVTLYIGFALGVLRYRLFDLDQWWFIAWLWFLGGVSVLVMDLALVAFLGMGPVEAVGIAVLLVAWGYLPLRHAIWRRLTGGSGRTVEERLPALAESIVKARGAENADEAWKDTLRSMLMPLSLREEPPAGESVTISEHGAELVVPGISEQRSFRLFHADGGRRLFSSRDQNTVDSLLGVGRRLFRARAAEEAGARNERARIIRDLHDDVGGRVLALIHSADTERQAELARKALGALRDTIGALDDQASAPLGEVLADWYDEAEQRAEAAGVVLDWENGVESLAEEELAPRQRINLRRVLDEALTNALRHADPERVRVSLKSRDGKLLAIIANDGLPEALRRTTELRPGRGLHNMDTRIRELGGDFEARVAGRGAVRRLVVRFAVPLDRFRNL